MPKSLNPFCHLQMKQEDRRAPDDSVHNTDYLVKQFQAKEALDNCTIHVHVVSQREHVGNTLTNSLDN